MYTRLVSWFKRKTDHPSILYILGTISFFESIIFPIPVDVFLIPLSSSHPQRWKQYATVATVTSVLGAIAGYLLGAFLFESFGVQLIAFYGFEEAFQKVIDLFQSNTFLVIFTSAFTPIPYKVFTLAAGASYVNIVPFILASILGRGLRFFIVSWIPYRYGARVSKTIERYFNRITWTLAALVIIYLVLWWFDVI